MILHLAQAFTAWRQGRSAGYVQELPWAMAGLVANTSQKAGQQGYVFHPW